MPPKRKAGAAAAAKAGACAPSTGALSVNGCGQPLLQADHLEAIKIVKPGEDGGVVADGAAKPAVDAAEAKRNKQALWVSMASLVVSIPALIGA